jgi:hypothetical protein
MNIGTQLAELAVDSENFEDGCEYRDVKGRGEYKRHQHQHSHECFAESQRLHIQSYYGARRAV